MGTQVYFLKEDALKAGAIFEMSYDKDLDEIRETYSIPGVEDRRFINYWCTGNSFSDLKLTQVCTDFNEWGSNKAILLPWLKENAINYYLG